MNSSTDEQSSEWHLGEAFTSYCFGELSDQDRHEVEEHLLACDVCWEEFRTLDAAVRALRSDQALGPVLPVHDVVSMLGLSGRLDRPFGGHGVFVLWVAALYGLEWIAGLWTELGYSYDRFGTLAWMLSVPTGAWVAASLLLSLWLDAKITRAGQTDGLLRSVTVILGALAALVVGLVMVLPAEPTIVASFQTRTASGGFLKDAVFIFLPLLPFILPSFHTIVQLQRELRSGRHRSVLSVLMHDPSSIRPRGMLYLSPRFLTSYLVVLGIVKIVGTNHMLDALTPGPFANLFSNVSYMSTALWFSIAVVSLVWYQNNLNELKREATVLAALTRQEPSGQGH